LRRRAAAPLAAALLSIFIASPARAEDVSIERFEQLVARAPSDTSALDRLRRVDSVDGRPVDMEAALDGASDEELAERLETLGGELGPPGGTSDAREQAASILAERRYREPPTPRPIKGVTDWLGDRLGGALRSFEDFIVRVLPGGMILFWILVAIVVVLIAVSLSGRAAGRSSRLRADGGRRGGRTIEDPGALEREAEAAERNGDLEASLRLRFRAGVLRLAERGALPRRASLTSEEIASFLGSATFERLAATFDRVVYGRQPASPQDVDEARNGWRRLAGEVKA
jgi:hypothetical protein